MAPFALFLLLGQTTIGPHGIRSNGVVIDDSGIHGAVIHGAAVAIDGNNAKRTYAGGGRSFAISGNGNRITITGNAARVTVSGNKNTITITGVGVIEVPGNENTVTWSRGLGKKPPRTSVLGNHNRVVGLP